MMFMMKLYELTDYDDKKGNGMIDDHQENKDKDFLDSSNNNYCRFLTIMIILLMIMMSI